MTSSSLLTEWAQKFTDPYAVLGVAVTADDRRVLKRYRAIAKLLHPDRYATADPEIREFASQMLARLVNPAYQNLKQAKNRAESTATLRFQVRRLSRQGTIAFASDRAQQLLKYPVAGVDIFYEQAIAELADIQFQPLDEFATVTEEMGELNLAYLQLKMGEVLNRERRTGLVAATEAKPMQFTPAPAAEEAATESYADRHYRRAKEYMKNANWSQAVLELRDAIKLEADRSEFHALLGIAYFQQNLTGMATVYLRQALKLNPNDRLARKYAPKIGLDVADISGGQNGKTATSTDKTDKKGGLFGLFRSKK